MIFERLSKLSEVCAQTALSLRLQFGRRFAFGWLIGRVPFTFTLELDIVEGEQPANA